MMRTIRGGAGLGDAIYVQGVVRHLAKHQELQVLTDWPEVFLPLSDRIKLAPFRRNPVDIVAHYANRRHIVTTTQFEDCCINAGIQERLELKLDWIPVNLDLIGRLRCAGMPVVVVQMPRAPFGRTDGFGMELLPNFRTIQRAIDRLKGSAFIVQIGQGKERFSFDGIDLDLSNKTSVSDVIDIGYAADGFLGYCSFIIPLAECFGKPMQLVWSRRGLNSRELVIRQMIPEKMLSLPTSRSVVDDCSDAELIEAVDALLAKV